MKRIIEPEYIPAGIKEIGYGYVCETLGKQVEFYHFNGESKLHVSVEGKKPSEIVLRRKYTQEEGMGLAEDKLRELIHEPIKDSIL